MSGGGERQRQRQPEERGGPGSQSAAHPSGAKRAEKQAGPGVASLDPPTVTPRPPVRTQDDEEAAAPHAAAGPHGQLGTVSVTPF